MNRKRNVNFTKPEDPPFLKVLKKQAGYDDSNHKFDQLEKEDFVSDDESELPQVIVLKQGDLTAEEANIEKEKIKKIENETKADLSQRVIFKTKKKSDKKDKSSKDATKCKGKTQLLSFANEEDDD